MVATKWRGTVPNSLLLLALIAAVGTAAAAPAPARINPQPVIQPGPPRTESLPLGFAPVAALEVQRRRRPHTGVVSHLARLSPTQLAARTAAIHLNTGGPPRWSPAQNPNATLEYVVTGASQAIFGPGAAATEYSVNAANRNGSLEVQFQGASGALYILDCAVQANQTYQVQSSFEGSSGMHGSVSTPDGHLIIPFPRAPSGGSDIAFANIDGPAFEFYGCQVDVAQ